MPINQAILPQLTALKARGADQELQRIYRRGTAFVAALVAPACLMLVFFGGQILWVWTGNVVIAREAAPITALYALGNCLAAFMTFTYFLQYAHGDMRLHLMGNIGFTIVLIPCLIFAATRFGAIGTGVVWCIQNLLYLSVWTYVIHRKFAPGLHWRWLGRDILAVVLPSAILLALASKAPIIWYRSRLYDFVLLAALALACAAVGAALTPGIKETLMSFTRSVKFENRKIG
jgi:O-antigen/teichoic acid export membrane protein